jgi:hypothetical protein
MPWPARYQRAKPRQENGHRYVAARCEEKGTGYFLDGTAEELEK